MAKITRKPAATPLNVLAQREPQLTILSDLPHIPDPDDPTLQDTFNLNYHLGPVFDIIRHKNQQTPFNIAIYGRWGTGKTSAMRWLESLLKKNYDNPTTNAVKTKTCWFYPWKYHSSEEIWRGLIAEVILKTLEIKSADTKTIVKAFKLIGSFLGKSAISLLDLIKLPGGVEINSDTINQIKEHYNSATHPESPYLNPYENAFQSWVKDLLGEDHRLIVFIDDLDRCMPEIALKVLEALKLYLNIEGLVFVMGLDPDVIRQVVYKHYEKFQSVLDDSNQSQENPSTPQLKPEDYLSKMFQIEVQLTRSKIQIEEYFDDLTKNFVPWQKLPDNDREIFKAIILKKAPDNPREIKRLINNSLLTAIGYESIPKEKRK